MVNPRLAETGILKSETETENFSDLIEKHICDRQTQNLRLRDPLLGCARFRDLGRVCRDFSFSWDHSPPFLKFPRKGQKNITIMLCSLFDELVNSIVIYPFLTNVYVVKPAEIHTFFYKTLFTGYFSSHVGRGGRGWGGQSPSTFDTIHPIDMKLGISFHGNNSQINDDTCGRHVGF